MSSNAAAQETEQVILALPRLLVRRAERIAQQTRRSLETVIAEWIDRAAADLPVEALEDVELLSICDFELSSPDQAELSTLLVENQEGRLDEAGRAVLDDRMREYDRLLLRKSQALREAVVRGLRPPLAA